MSFNDKKIWDLAEKLYLHCLDENEIINFFTGYNLRNVANLYNPPYDRNIRLSGYDEKFFNFIDTNVDDLIRYSFLEKVIYDELFSNSTSDPVQYGDEKVSDWHPELIKLLEGLDYQIDFDRGILINKIDGEQYLNCRFENYFLDKIRTQINSCYIPGHYLAVALLSRKLAESIVTQVLEKVFPGNAGVGIYWDNTHRRYEKFWKMIDQMRNNASSVYNDEDLVRLTCDQLDKMRDGLNDITHKSYYDLGNPNLLNKYQIREVINRLHMIYNHNFS